MAGQPGEVVTGGDSAPVLDRGPVRRQVGDAGAGPEEIAPGVYRVETGHGLTQDNVYLVRSGPAWVLIDTAWPGRGQQIRAAAESLFGAGTRPDAILLTHIHPDHAGSALELARLWDLPVHVHPRELPLASGRYLPQYANPLDRWLVAPVLALLPRRAVEASVARSSLEGTAIAFDPVAGVPGLPDWQAVPTPGHTPGHVAFFRSEDRVLISGDAVLTVNLNSVADLLTGKRRVAGPPYISTWNWPAAKESVAALARLEPDVLACGHGRPMTGAGAAAGLASFSAHLSQQSSRRRSLAGVATPAGKAPDRGGQARPSARISFGATAEERAMPLPGDDLVPSPIAQTTHAVTINAPPQQVWPWLVQIGHGRAGFYSDSKFWDRCVDWYYRRLSRHQAGKAPVGYHIAADDRIVGAWQNPQVGDVIPDGPPGTAYYVVRQAEPGRSFVLFTDTHLGYLVPVRLRGNPRLGISGELSASYLLAEPEPGTTRVIRRMRFSCGPWPFRAYAAPIVLIWGEAITAPNLLRGVKRRAEAARPQNAKGANMSDVNSRHGAHGGQNGPEDHSGATGPTHPSGHGHSRPVREFRMSPADRVGNAVFSLLTRAGIGPAHLLTTRGRKTGRPRTNPVILVQQEQQRWLVAPYGAVSWVLNARATGWVTLRHGRDRQDYAIRELPPAQAGPILKRYIRIAPASRPYFQARKGAPAADFTAEADRHPVFELTCSADFFT